MQIDFCRGGLEGNFICFYADFLLNLLKKMTKNKGTLGGSSEDD